MKQKYFYSLIIFLFLFRIIFGLCTDFWQPDEIQIYLIGLKSFTTGTWPFYGPDVVYTNTQISGALQGLLVSIPFYLLKIPESPSIFLNILSFCSFSLLAFYISKRISGIPKWVIWLLVLTTPWALHFSTMIVNPSYVIIFSIPFFLSVLDILPIYEQKIIKPQLAFFTIGITTTLIMQLHMSFVLLIPYTALVFIHVIRTYPRKLIIYTPLYLLGILIGLSTLIPTFIYPDLGAKSTASNIIFNFNNIQNYISVLMKFLSFASFEIPYMLGGAEEQLRILKGQFWMVPVAAVLLVAGFLQVGLFIVTFFLNKEKTEWRKIKWFTFYTWQLIFVSFFFSIKGPSPHTFYLMLPIAIVYSFYCYQWAVTKKVYLLKYLKIIAICGLFFHFGLGIYNYQNKSLYINRGQAQKALDNMDFKILGHRRAEAWGHGY